MILSQTQTLQIDGKFSRVYDYKWYESYRILKPNRNFNIQKYQGINHVHSDITNLLYVQMGSTTVRFDNKTLNSNDPNVTLRLYFGNSGIDGVQVINNDETLSYGNTSGTYLLCAFNTADTSGANIPVCAFARIGGSETAVSSLYIKNDNGDVTVSFNEALTGFADEAICHQIQIDFLNYWAENVVTDAILNSQAVQNAIIKAIQEQTVDVYKYVQSKFVSR